MQEPGGTSERSFRRLLLQQLESLQRSGVTQLKSSKRPDGAAVSSPELATSRLTEQPAPTATVTAGARDVKSTAEPPIATARDEPTGTTQLPAEQPPSELAVIQSEVAACRRCEHLACTRTQTVFGVGNPRPRLCFLGEAPGADEDRRGEPFVGRAGQLLTDIIQKAMKLKRSDVYILNVLKCRPPDNRTPTDQEIANCREYFERQLEVLQPEFICCLGATAVRALLHKTQSLGRLRGQWFDYGDARVIVTYHPSYLLRNPAAKKDTWEDIQLLMREMGLPVVGEDRG